MELSDYRRQIDDIDSQLLALFYRRMDVAAQIGGYKKAHNLPALDAGRERAKLQQIADSAPGGHCVITRCRSIRSFSSSAAAARIGCSASRVR